MLSFPSTLNESQSMYGSNRSSSYDSTFDIERLRALNLNSSVPVLQELLKEQNINIASFRGRPIMNTIDEHYNIGGIGYKDEIYYESPLTLPSELIATAKDYEWVYNKKARTILSVGKSDKSMIADIAHQTVTPSMFNSHFGVNTLGLMSNVPLLNDMWVNNNIYTNSQFDEKNRDEKIKELTKGGVDATVAAQVVDTEIARAKDLNNGQSGLRLNTYSRLSDCSIRELCTLSKKPNSILGQARYKYADFMYCKYLGKVPNNRLITLRRFAHPVGDHIFEMSSPKYSQKGTKYTFEQEGDVGRLISWFDTDDNKLEDIIKFSYHATWKQLTSQIEEKPGTADDSSSGILGMIANSLNPTYNAYVGSGNVGTHSLLGYLGANITQNVTQGIGKNNELLTNYDKNKVYEPADRIQSTHIYDGALEFNHQFTLNFSYVLRGYENINPKSAFLDLIGNILEVTYKRGKFWGGARKTIGPNANISMFKKVHSYIDDAWDKAGGFLDTLCSGGFGFNEILGMVGRGLSNLVNSIANTAKGIINDPTGTLAEYGARLKNLASTSNMGAALKGYLKNAIGRPQMIAWQSLLDGSDVGLWHVTIGNPKNPIVVMGNLILEDASITQLGPLGLDDFPSELKVSVTLKHARPRDITDIGKMYTKGLQSLYKSFEHHNLSDFYKMQSGKDSTQELLNNVYAAEATHESIPPEAVIKDKEEMTKQAAAKAPEEANKNNSDNNTNTQQPQNQKEEPKESKSIPYTASAYSSASNTLYEHELEAYANDNMYFYSDHDPRILSDDEARIMQANNYSFEMERLSQSEIA